MRVRVVGQSTKNIDNEDLKQAAIFYLKELIKDIDVLKELYVTIKFEPDLNVMGYCEWTDTPIWPRNFTISMNVNFGKRIIFKSLAHECVHIKQQSQNELTQNFAKFKMMKWHGKNHRFIDDYSKSYYYQPWEIEANGLMEFLYNEYMACKDLKRRGLVYNPDI